MLSSFARTGSIGPELKIALKWWKAVLNRDVVETHPWKVDERALAHLFVDARSTPARCAAVLYLDGPFQVCKHVLNNLLCCEGEWLYTDGMPPEELMNKLQTRNDNQIMSLEVMAISLGLRTFAKELKGRRVLVYAQPARKCICMHFNVAGKQ